MMVLEGEADIILSNGTVSRVAEINQYYLTREEACKKLIEYRAKFRRNAGK